MHSRAADRTAERFVRIVLAICLSVLCSLCVCVAVRTVGWPLAGDASLIHYVVFLLDSGRKPYAQIRDINLPGAYLADWLVVHLLGAGALADRIFDYGLSIASAFAAWWIAGGVCGEPTEIPKSGFGARAVGIFAAAMFFLLHAKDGIVQTGQRDWTMTVLVLLALAAWLHATRSGSRWFCGVAGILLGSATAIKPCALLFALPLAAERLWNSRGWSQGRKAVRTCLLLGAGLLLPIGACVAWLIHEDSLHAFFTSGIPMMQYHASLQRETMIALVTHGISGIHVLILFGALLLPMAWPLLRGTEFSLLCAQTVVGFICYAMQGKGYAYQRYPFAFFLLEVVGLIFVAALSCGKTWVRWTAIVSLCVSCLWVAPQAAMRAVHYRGDQDQFGSMLRSDLKELGGSQLDGKVQCLDTFSGCIRVLYELRLHQSTGTIYDEFLFGRTHDQPIAESRAVFVDELRNQEPEVLVITPQNYPGRADGYDKIGSWPWFASYLSENYDLCVQRTPTMPQLWEGNPRVPLGYRIYVRRNITCAASPSP